MEMMHPETSVYHSFGPDPLHCAEGGLEGAHDWPWTIAYLGADMSKVDDKYVGICAIYRSTACTHYHSKFHGTSPIPRCPPLLERS